MELEEYLKAIPDARAARFSAIRDLIRRQYPDAVESMRYRMPTFEVGEGWVALANQKQYISLYTCSAEHLESFRQLHPEIKTGKGCINFRDRDDIPLDSIVSVIESAMEYTHG